MLNAMHKFTVKEEREKKDIRMFQPENLFKNKLQREKTLTFSELPVPRVFRI